MKTSIFPVCSIYSEFLPLNIVFHALIIICSLQPIWALNFLNIVTLTQLDIYGKSVETTLLYHDYSSFILA